MDMLKLHAEALQETSTAYHEFLLKYKPRAAFVYGFVEGKEDPFFYRGLIEKSLPTGWEVELIASGSRSNVLKVLSEFNWETHSRNQVCFFIDRDLADFLGLHHPNDENLYVTDGYSIESEALTFGAFKAFLEEVFSVATQSIMEREALRTAFDSHLAVFREALLPVMAQVVLWFRSGDRPNLSNIDVRRFFEFSNGSVKIPQEFLSPLSRATYAAQCVGLRVSADADRLAVEGEFLAKVGWQRFIRGKYALWFLVETMTMLHKSISEVLPRYAEPPKVRVAIGHKNAMVVLAPRVRCPESLAAFIDRQFVRFTRGELDSKTEETKDRVTLFEKLAKVFRRLAFG